MLLPASFGSARCPGCSAYKAGRRHVRVQAEPEDEAPPAPKKRLSKPKGERRRPTELPRTGFFGLADTKGALRLSAARGGFRAPAPLDFAGVPVDWTCTML